MAAKIMLPGAAAAACAGVGPRNRWKGIVELPLPVERNRGVATANILVNTLSCRSLDLENRSNEASRVSLRCPRQLRAAATAVDALLDLLL